MSKFIFPRSLLFASRAAAQLSLVVVLFVAASTASAQTAAPTISSFSPTSGPVGTTLVIDGTNFVPPLTVSFGGNVQAEGSFRATQVTVTVPAGALTGLIEITTAGGSAKTATSFTVGFAVPTATLAVTVPSATVGSGVPAEFTVSLSGAQATDVIVNYTLSGNATNGTDYGLLKGTAKIKAGKTSKVIKVTPQGDLDGAAKKTVKLTLAHGTGYNVGTATFEKVKIVAAQ